MNPKPSPAAVDTKLFARAPLAVQALQRKARLELRAKARKAFWEQAQRQNRP